MAPMLMLMAAMLMAMTVEMMVTSPPADAEGWPRPLYCRTAWCWCCWWWCCVCPLLAAAVPLYRCCLVVALAGRWRARGGRTPLPLHRRPPPSHHYHGGGGAPEPQARTTGRRRRRRRPLHSPSSVWLAT